jgi:hypothetical protein
MINLAEWSLKISSRLSISAHPATARRLVSHEFAERHHTGLKAVDRYQQAGI